jgi:hypothetical protein
VSGVVYDEVTIDASKAGCLEHKMHSISGFPQASLYLFSPHFSLISSYNTSWTISSLLFTSNNSIAAHFPLGISPAFLLL